ncbi:Fe2OG dioxygenase domain-containing protein [Mycena indigotica]|uniref:Fe2OG dioxygenase domain-containing protein n=1 Tax=Mycena indigotica TaxID=2126181 RepID=A0A8H6S423_9AGAR|nr:Fe2OG dioxygenase domain-containing protein [Mycena indigotica]KAF7292042.1 Fe2OG dioxygenase domain-containing protein [Mycena indigotica]
MSIWARSLKERESHVTSPSPPPVRTSFTSSPPSMAPKQTHSVTLGAGDALGTGDSYLKLNVLPTELSAIAFDRLKQEVRWAVMHHRGGEVPRLVAVEGEVLPDGSFPIYRHPADFSPPLLVFSPTVSVIRTHVEAAIGHPLNHVLIQLYRNGADYISDHSDKTIDVVHGSSIVNVSLGAQRVMVLRNKKVPNTTSEDTAIARPPPRPTQRIPLPHNSLFVLGPNTNSSWLHGIPHDNRPLTIKSADEQAMGGERISLTFRHIGTFLTNDGAGSEPQRIFGQGAKGKTRDDAGVVLKGEAESAGMREAFGRENQMSGEEWDWERWYGEGFDVVDLV